MPDNPPLHAPGVRKIPICHCLDCGYRVNAAAAPDNNQCLPSPGDVTICMKCGAVMMFDDDMTLRGMSENEINELTSDSEWMDSIARLVQRIHYVRSAGN